MEKDLNDIRNDGYKAASDGVLLKNNPYDMETKNVFHWEWRNGWLEYAQESM